MAHTARSFVSFGVNYRDANSVGIEGMEKRFRV